MPVDLNLREGIDILGERLHNLSANCGYSEDPECRRKLADWRPHSSKFCQL